MSDPAVVLYVEDEENDAFFMQLAFERAGLGDRLRTVGNAREAMGYLDKADRTESPAPSPCMILLDLNLPVMSGFEFLEWLRSESAYRDLPVLIFSSSSREEDRERARRLGANDFVAKPNSAMQFSTIVDLLKSRWLKAN